MVYAVSKERPRHIPLILAQNLPLRPSGAPQTDDSLFWAKYPILKRISACESTGDKNGTPRQFNDDGSILWGHERINGKVVVIKRDAGEFQINTIAHADELKKLGLDVVNSESDNRAYALILYLRNGTADWNASKATCWGK